MLKRFPQLAAAAFIACCAATTPAQAKEIEWDSVVYGPVPTWEHFKEVTEQAVREKLVDPASAQFTWPWGFRQGWYQPAFSHRIYGYTTCGIVNSRNRMGGYAGNNYFVIVIDHEQVLYLDIAQNGGNALGNSCVATRLPPIPAPHAAETGPPPFGLEITVMPDGAYVRSVIAESSAARAGIKPGMVIAKINGIALKGMAPEATTQMLAGVSGPANFEIIGGGTITVAQP